jgi:hypothetical protein
MFVPHISRASAQKQCYRTCHHFATLRSPSLRCLCICCKALPLKHKSKSQRGIAAYTAAPPCNRHLPAASGTGTKAMRLRCWHKPMLLQASHASQATLRSCLRPADGGASGIPPAVRMAGGGGRSAFLLFAAFVPHFASFIQASLPMAAVHISTLDYSHDEQ